MELLYTYSAYSDASPSSWLIASKSKVAPLKPITVPQLELMGVVLSLRLRQQFIARCTRTDNASVDILFR